MKDTLALDPGMPQPEGVVILPEGTNFALFSRHAASVSLVLDLDPSGEGLT